VTRFSAFGTVAEQYSPWILANACDGQLVRHLLAIKAEMTRSSMICTMGLALATCASLPETRTGPSLADATPLSEELECMCDCLGEGDSDGDSCVVRCF